MDEIIQAMTDVELDNFKTQYADNPSIVKLIEGYQATRLKVANEAEAKLQFNKSITKLFAKLPHPEDIYNIYITWGEVTIIDGEPEDVEVVDANGNKTMEQRQPSHQDHAWIVDTNHVTRGNSSNEPKTNKRAITLFKRNGLVVEPKGNFSSGQKACDHFKIVVGKDSAPRALAREGYIVEPYEGVDYIS